jgi:hypothetical protein
MATASGSDNVRVEADPDAKVSQEHLTRLKGFLGTSDYKYEEFDGEGLAAVVIPFTSKHFELRMYVLATPSTFWCLSTIPLVFKSEKRAQVLELLNDMNSNFPQGTFYLEKERVYYRTSLRVKHLTEQADAIFMITAPVFAIDSSAERLKALA